MSRGPKPEASPDATEPVSTDLDSNELDAARSGVGHGESGEAVPEQPRQLTGHLGNILRNVVIIGGGLVAYLAVRAITAGEAHTAEHNASLLLRFERAAGLEWEANIQQMALDHDWLVSIANWIYAFAYWPVIIATLVFTYFRHRHLFRRYRNSLFVSGLVGLLVFAMFPVAPPRFLSGYVDTVNEAARHNYIAHPSWLINENAALPSFHVGWVALSAVLLFPVLQSRLAKVLLLVPAVIMGAVVVVTGNHYLVDVILGVAICMAALAVNVWRERPAQA